MSTISVDLPAHLYNWLETHSTEIGLEFEELVETVTSIALKGYADAEGYKAPGITTTVPVKTHILALLGKQGGLTVADLTRKMGGKNPTTVRSALYRMEKRGKVLQTKDPEENSILWWIAD